MRVLIDTTFALRGHSGTGVYIERLIQALDGLGVDVVETSNDARRAPAGGGMRSLVNAAVDAWWTAAELPRRARMARADVVHHPLPAHSPLPGVGQVVTVHDLAFERLPEAFDPAFRRWAHRAHRRAARSADVVVAVSRTTATDVRARWGVPAERIVVARHGPGQEPDAVRPREREVRHVLYVGDGEPRKNLAFLLAAHRLYRESSDAPLPLVLAGSARAGRDAEDVQEVDRPDAEALAALYAGAAALVHPSLHEGFGLTPLEAMSAGVPVVAACVPGVVEVVGDAAVLVDPHDASALAATLGRVATDERLRRDLTERGRRRAAEFSWARSARDHVRAYTLANEAVHG